MNMKNRFLDKELSIQSEYDKDFSEKSTQLKLLLESAIISGNIDVVRKVATDAGQVKDLKLLFDTELEILKLYIASTITSFVETAIQQGLPKDVAESAKRKFYVLIVNTDLTAQLEDYYFQMVEELILKMNRYSMKHYSPKVKMAIEFIHNNKFKFIYSKDVSDAIQVNRSYLSKIFKKETGQNITDYIHKVKMDLAIRLMESNIYKFHEISELLGYKNYSYFSKVFKKIHSVTPYDYIK